MRQPSLKRATWALVALLALDACADEQPGASDDSEASAGPQAQLWTRDAGTSSSRGNDPNRQAPPPQQATISSSGSFSGSLCRAQKPIDSSSGAFTAHVDQPLDN